MDKLPHRCLMIDDDADDQEIFELCLQGVTPCIDLNVMNSGPEALDYLKNNPSYLPRWIFLDMNMPRMNGIACLKELRGIERLKDTRIYMYSTTKQPGMEEQASALGATGFIVKPVKPSELKIKLQELLSAAG